MMNHLLKHLAAGFVVAVLVAGCKTSNTVRITEAPPQPLTAPRSEPIFYNGKTYQLDFSPAGSGLYNMAVSGMGPKQQKDAVQLATSSLSYYACPDGHRGRIEGVAAYASSKWRLQARCG